MVKCPFCGFDNEDGALFCEQCKSDLSSVPPPPPPPPTPPPAPHEAPVPFAAIVEAAPAVEFVEPIPVVEPMPMAEVVAAPPAAEIVAPPVEAVPAAPAAPPAPPAEFVAAAAAPAAAPAAPPAAKGASVPAGSKPKLVVKRGQKIGFEFPIYPEDNYVGRSDEKPVDIDLEDQEPPERVWCSRQHALIHFDENTSTITLEDLNSSNGTYVNRERVYPGQPRQLFVNDTIQIGTVHLSLKV